jgi:hypothetical protein
LPFASRTFVISWANAGVAKRTKIARAAFILRVPLFLTSFGNRFPAQITSEVHRHVEVAKQLVVQFESGRRTISRPIRFKTKSQWRTSKLLSQLHR